MGIINGLLYYTLRERGMSWSTIANMCGCSTQAALQGAARWAKTHKLRWPINVVCNQNDPQGLPIISLAFNLTTGELLGGGVDTILPVDPVTSTKVEGGSIFIYQATVADFLEKFRKTG